MKNFVLCFCIFLTPSLTAFSQNGDFPFGKITHEELGMKIYEPDTSASAVILNEFGRAYFNDEVHIVFERHVKIKILKKSDVDLGNFSVSLYKGGDTFEENERWVDVKASTFNYEGNGIVESKIDPKEVVIEKTSSNFNTAKFALRNVKVGSVLEVGYITESPYIFNFKTWYFQSEIPKVRSEFWASLPANFNYTVNMTGFQKLTSQQVDLERECFLMPGAGTDGTASSRSSCSVGKYVLENIPAFKEESFISSTKNFISAIHYELSEVTYPGGRKDKYSEEWEDVDRKLKEHDDFGSKIKKAKRMYEDLMPGIVGSEVDEIKKANLIYTYVNNRYNWDGSDSKYASQDVKKCFENKKGNSADLNLALVGALQAAGLNADPVILSTRDNGIPFKMQPRRSDFNYVVSSLKIGTQLILLDATDPLLPFSALPIKCINDQGRLISKSESSWVDLRSTQKYRTTFAMNLKLTEALELGGNIVMSSYGYSALDKRKEINGSKTLEEYTKNLSTEWGNISIKNYQIENKDDVSKPLIEKMDVGLSELDNTGSNVIYFNPFLTGRFDKNPFKSNERLYPVDLGAPNESTYFISIELPDKIKVDEIPGNMAIGLPNNGGKFVVNVTQNGNKITLSSILSLAKPIYSSAEYHSLKEFFARVVQMQQSQFVFKVK